MSATMALATSHFSPSGPSNTLCVTRNVEVQSTTSAVKMQSLTGGEQYWAARALKAEALLTANHGYYKDVKAVEEVQDMKREVCIDLVRKRYLLTSKPI